VRCFNLTSSAFLLSEPIRAAGKLRGTAAEFERRGALPSLPHQDQAQLALIENALHAERPHCGRS